MMEFLIQSHRGAGVLAPENTIEAFDLAWSLGTVPEADLRTTRDGVIVAFHDKDFDRVVRGLPPELSGKGVADVTFEELAALDVGSWHGESFAGRRVSPIAEVFERLHAVPTRSLYLDIKVVSLPRLAALVGAAGVEKQVILASPNPEAIREWHALAPEGQALLWMGGPEAELRTRIEALKVSGFVGITQLQIHVRASGEGDSLQVEPSSDFLRELGRELSSRGIVFQALPWHTADPEVYARLLDLGVQSFATDFPDATLRAVREYFTARQS